MAFTSQTLNYLTKLTVSAEIRKYNKISLIWENQEQDRFDKIYGVVSLAKLKNVEKTQEPLKASDSEPSKPLDPGLIAPINW